MQGAWREFVALEREPSAWGTLGESNSDTGNDTWNSGSLAVTRTSGNALAQAGLQITTAAQATLQVIVAAMYGWVAPG